MNPDPNQPQVRTSPALQPQPRQDPLNGARVPQAPSPPIAPPVASPVAPQVTPEPIAPVQPVALSPVSLVPQPEPTSATVLPVQPLNSGFGERALQPLDEAAVLRDRAVVDAGIAQTPPMDGVTTVASPVETTQVHRGVPPTGEVELVPDPIDDDRMSIARRVIGGLFIGVAWLGAMYGLSVALSAILVGAIKANPSESAKIVEVWLPVATALPYIAAAIVAIVAIPLLMYPRGIRRLMFALGAVLALVGFANMIAYIPGASEYLMSPLVAVAALFSDSEYIQRYVGRAWMTVGVVALMGVIVVSASYAIMRSLRKLPARISIVIFIVITLLPVGASLLLDKLNDPALKRDSSAYMLVEERVS